MDLTEFLTELRKLLDRIVKEAEDIGLPPFAGDLLREAWRELQPTYDQLEEEVRSGKYEEQLHEHGLTGAQLELKLEPFRRTLKLVEAAERSEPPRHPLGAKLRRL